jgi:endonuclease YncB( thermonuclease family)
MAQLRHALLRSIGLLVAFGTVSCTTGPQSVPAERPPTPAAKPSSPAPSAELPAPGEEQPVLVGTVLSITDGDTIKVQLSSGPITVRFDSIDAPEKNQPWGREAYVELLKRLNQQVVSIEVMTQDRYDRLVAVVCLGDENINGWMVQQGHAWAYRQYLSMPNYCNWQESARSKRSGL